MIVSLDAEPDGPLVFDIVEAGASRQVAGTEPTFDVGAPLLSRSAIFTVGRCHVGTLLELHATVAGGLHLHAARPRSLSMESQDRELLRAIDRKVDAIQEESETYVAESSEVLARLEALRSDFEETRADVKSIATKIWRGNGGSSILERLASLETAVRDRGPALPSGSLRLWLLGGTVILALALCLLAFILGQENIRLFLVWLK